ncbi:hypothetical protein [Mycolicibacterium sp. P9-22]|uniref:hypothetical protein n=1 Tax=Mycolicibacterium sp. P9-22 TaxID=2024613 RepID=UPI0011ECA327|nr:hypothetical protein [Mycolicibacterium sp. P9-22]
MSALGVSRHGAGIRNERELDLASFSATNPLRPKQQEYATAVTYQNPFSMHRQKVWLERAADPKLPRWVRVSALAFARHKGNGHACFRVGEIATLLGSPDPNGNIKPVAGSVVSDAIRAAKKKEWIAPQSHARCLVVPPHAIQGGLGASSTVCPFHAVTRQRSGSV